MKSIRWTSETALYILAFSLALLIRLLQLGASPLPDFEAGWALQALHLARGQSFSMGPQPVYVILTGLLFFIFGSTSFMARLVPALAGSLLVFLPMAFRKSLGRYPALIAAFGLALDPGLVALSRLAGGPMPAVSFGLLALTAFYFRRYILAGILAGLALLSGPALLTGLLGLFMTYLAVRTLEISGSIPPFSANGHAGGEAGFIPTRTILGYLIGTVLVIGTLFLLVPQSLGAAVAAIPAYLSGWITPSGVPALRIPAVLLTYEPLIFIFGLIGLVRAWTAGSLQDYASKRLGIWFIFALLIAVLYPARQLDDLAWALIPLWGLASIELVRDLTLLGERQSRLASIGQALLLLTLFAYAWENILGIDQLSPGLTSDNFRNILYLTLGALALGAVTTILVALGWTWPTARSGLAWGAGIALSLYMLSATVATAQIRNGNIPDISNLWMHPPAAGQAELLSQTIQNMDVWKKGQGNDLKIVSLVDDPAIHWLLRDWPNASFQSGVTPGSLPDIILSFKEQATPSLTASYRGQDFSWQVTPAWQGILPSNLPKWLAFRRADETDRLLVLWARSDLFPGGASTSPSTSQP